MKIKVRDATNRQLDWLVMGLEFVRYAEQGDPIKPWVLRDYEQGDPRGNPTTDWLQGGPIIEREVISLSSQTNGHSWAAKQKHNYSYGDSPLIAVMRCYIAAKLGDEVDVPDVIQE